MSPAELDQRIDMGSMSRFGTTGMDSQGDEGEEDDDFDGIEDVSPSQMILPSARKPKSVEGEGKGNKQITLADLFSDDEADEPLAIISARREGNARLQSESSRLIKSSADHRNGLPEAYRSSRSDTARRYIIVNPSICFFICNLQE